VKSARPSVSPDVMLFNNIGDDLHMRAVLLNIEDLSDVKGRGNVARI
jgi:hypothetical protein